MTDQAQTVGTSGESLSPEVADYFKIDEAPKSSPEKVTPDGTGEKAVADTTKENASESKKEDDVKSDDQIPTEDKKTTETKKEEGEDTSKDAAQPTEFEVAGTKYSTLEEAVKAVNRINGDNTRLSGETKALRKEKNELASKTESLEKLLDDYKKANLEWQKYYEDGGDKPDTSKIDIEKAIEKKVSEIKEKEKLIDLKTQYDNELDEIFAEPDFEQVKSVFEELVNEYDGLPKVSPKKLYERAKILAKKDLLKEGLDIEKMVDERVQKKLNQKEASKTSNDSGGSSDTVDPLKGLSPEVAEYFKQRM